MSISSVKYYSIYFLECDNWDDDFDLLSHIRSDYFTSYKKIKNKITKAIGSHVFKFSYVMQEGHPLKWKKMKDDKVVQKSVANSDGSYKVNTYENNKVIKTCYFSSSHEIEKIEYFKTHNYKKVILIPDCNKETIKIVRLNKQSKTDCELYPYNEYISDKEIEILSMYIGKPLLFTLSDKGESYYYLKDKVKQIKGLLSDIRNKDNKIMLVSDNEAKSCFNSTEDEKQEPKKNDLNEVADIDNSIEKNFEVLDGSGANKMSTAKEDTNNKLGSFNNISVKSDADHCDKTIHTLDNKTYYYFGKLNDNMRNGRGRTAVSSFQTAYEGEYVCDKRDGFGVYYYKSGKVCYVGSWKKDKRNGMGVSFIKDNDCIHIGNWNDDCVDGMSCIISKSGNLTFCPQANESEYKKAVVSYKPLDEKFIVSSVKDSKKTGKITEFDKDGNLLFTGYYENSKRNGFGISYNINGEVRYKGNFKDDMFNGEGTIYFDNGHKIEGKFESDKLIGTAREYDSSGHKIYEGEFQENYRYNGSGEYFFEDGRYCKGQFVNGLPSKFMSLYDNNGKLIYKGHLDKNYKYSGYGECYADGIKVYEGEFKNNKRCGFGKSYRKNEELEFIGRFDNDLFNGQGIYYEKGKAKYVGCFLNGHKHKRVNEIKDNKIYRECIYEKGKLVYMNEYSKEQGNLVLSGNIQNGKLSGMGCVFTEFGEKKYEGIFSDGSLLRHMKVSLEKLESLPECEYLSDTEYENFRCAVEFAVEKNIMGGIYSGTLLNNMPNGKGTILYPDHRYTGCFEHGKPKGMGIIYKNDGNVIKCKVVKDASENTREITFMNGIKYNIADE